jgi:homoserine dehydrogenase
LLGFGTVGSSFAEVLAAGAHKEIQITRVFNRGVQRKREHERAKFVPASAIWTERVEDVLTAPDVDAVVELIGGLDPVEG